MLLTPAQVWKSLPGKWSISREMIGHRGVSLGHAKGIGSFEPNRFNTLNIVYNEKGTLFLPQLPPGSYYKNYHYLFKDENIYVYFDSELTSLFHRIDFQHAQPTGEHLCSLDKYTMFYEFQSEKCFIMTCKVEGPHKNYTIQTLFEKTFSKF